MNHGTGNKYRLALLEPIPFIYHLQTFHKELENNNLKNVNLFDNENANLNYSPGKNFAAERNNNQKSLFSSVIDHVKDKRS